MKTLTRYTKTRFLREHLRHRLTLLRTLRERTKTGYNFQGQGDIYRCVKDSNLIAVRLLLDFLGLKSEYRSGRYVLVPSSRKIGRKWQNDVKIDQFIGRLLTPRDVPSKSRSLLAGVYRRAYKELAHLTLTFNKKFNEEEALIDAATALEGLRQEFLYGRTRLPTINA
jgi:hypothetical protein